MWVFWFLPRKHNGLYEILIKNSWMKYEDTW